MRPHSTHGLRHTQYCNTLTYSSEQEHANIQSMTQRPSEVARPNDPNGHTAGIPAPRRCSSSSHQTTAQRDSMDTSGRAHMRGLRDYSFGNLNSGRVLPTTHSERRTTEAAADGESMRSAGQQRWRARVASLASICRPTPAVDDLKAAGGGTSAPLHPDPSHAHGHGSHLRFMPRSNRWERAETAGSAGALRISAAKASRKGARN